ncbi:polymer-forming cytoskeletal protein [Vibrio sp. Of7-15]|uniref:bactofilin family protein n=1 Tax=Vibrio sp. Of7-15 TaxID=2724879 RepID=UPI001EF393B8|nr:polymer-forming cytoskeletal protein [Vibrio sp. Of7-15]MCG7495682.1 polymer-forming cytoskeletal protein [Vibrio sp. Of7-15]
MGLFSQKQQKPASTSLSVIAKGCRINGEISVEQDIQIDGFVEGTIATEKNVFITPTGRVQGEIHASHVIINGLVEGSCHCHEVNIQSQGQMKGTIHSQQLTIEKGGVLIGENREIAPSDAVTTLDTSKNKNNKENNPKEKADKTA